MKLKNEIIQCQVQRRMKGENVGRKRRGDRAVGRLLCGSLECSMETLKQKIMEGGKGTELDGITVEFWKCGCQSLIE